MVSHLAEKMPGFYGRRSVIAFTRSLLPGPILSQMKPVDMLPPILFKVHFNIL
jgi:hypothetical protein